MARSKFWGKRTISYIEAIVYILAIIVAIFACDCGPIYIKMLPLLFVLGFVGSIIFDRPVVTTVFGVITALCIVKLTSNVSFFDNLFISLCNGLNIALGELFGEYFMKSRKLFIKKKKLKSKGVLKTYILSVVILIVSIGVHLYTSGDYISYFKARSSLFSYLSENYQNQEFKVYDCEYNFYKTKSYTFEMRNISKNVNTNFIVLRDNDYAVYDEYKFTVQSQNNTKLNFEFYNFMKNIDTNLDVKIGYLESGDVKLLITKQADSVNESVTNEFVTEVNMLLSDLENFSRYNDIKIVEVSVIDKTNKKNSLVSDFLMEDIKKSQNTYEYILNSLTIEFIDE